MKAPRLWTPRPWSEAVPLYVTPRNPKRRTLVDEVVEVSRSLGFEPMPWQVDHWATYFEVTGKPGDEPLWYRDGDITVPRQTAKTTSTLIRHVDRQVNGERRGWGAWPVGAFTMQHAADARKKMVYGWFPILERSGFFIPSGKPNKGGPDSDIAQFLKTNGLESIIWREGGRIITFPPNDTGAHGDVLDEVDIDEAFAFDDDRAELGARPAMITRPSPRLTRQSTAGTKASVYLRGRVDSGRALVESGVESHRYYLEYAANPEAGDDIHNPEHWPRWMPALGYTITLEALKIEHDNYMSSTDADKGEAGWARAFCNLWTSVASRIIPEREWNLTRDIDSRIKDHGRLYLAADTSPSLTGNRWSAITVSGYREDGRIHTEVIEHAAGVNWLVDAIAALTRKWSIDFLRVDPKSPIAAVLPDIERVANTTIVKTDTETMAAACGRLHEDIMRTAKAIREHADDDDQAEFLRLVNAGFAHLGQAALDVAAEGAAKRLLLDGFAFARRTSSSDICPLVAAAQSHWDAVLHPPLGLITMAV